MKLKEHLYELPNNEGRFTVYCKTGAITSISRRDQVYYYSSNVSVEKAMPSESCTELHWLVLFK